MDPFHEKWATSGTNLTFEQYQAWYRREYGRLYEEQQRRTEEYWRIEEQRVRREYEAAQAQREAAVRQAQEEERQRLARKLAYERRRVAALTAVRRQEEYQRIDAIRQDREAEDLKLEAAYLEFRNSSEPWASPGAAVEEEPWQLSPDLLEALG